MEVPRRCKDPLVWLGLPTAQDPSRVQEPQLKKHSHGLSILFWKMGVQPTWILIGIYETRQHVKPRSGAPGITAALGTKPESES